MAVTSVRDLKPGDVIRNCGELKIIESISPGETGYWLNLGTSVVFYRFGSRLLVVDEEDVVDEAERIVGDAQYDVYLD